MFDALPSTHIFNLPSTDILDMAEYGTRERMRNMFTDKETGSLDADITREAQVKYILNHSTQTVLTLGKKTTVLHAILPSGFEVTVSSECANPDDYDRAIGIEVAREKLKAKVWELVAYHDQRTQTS